MESLQRRTFLKSAALLTLGTLTENTLANDSKATLTMVVMDPLSAELACPCVKGYAQRDYAKLAKFIETKIGQPIKCVYGDSLAGILAKKSEGKADIIIGKESVIRNDSIPNKIAAKPLAALTGHDGKTTMTGLVIVATKDPALGAGDLKDYQILFGSAICDEKHSAAVTLLKDLGLNLPKTLETCPTCGDGAKKVVDGAKKGEKIATVISSYAKPLLEGCGTIEKGDVRVIGETEPVPFIVAFANEQLPEQLRNDIQKALFAVGQDKDLCTAMETKSGFVELPAKKK